MPKAAKRELGKPVFKKEPVTPDMILYLCNRFAGPNANLSDLRSALLPTRLFSVTTSWLAFVVVTLVFVVHLLGLCI